MKMEEGEAEEEVERKEEEEERERKEEGKGRGRRWRGSMPVFRRYVESWKRRLTMFFSIPLAPISSPPLRLALFFNRSGTCSFSLNASEAADRDRSRWPLQKG
uniref:Uncharacterized protein n=1 Tax=Nelumbo nucifera TaxID=4432 RepID=A0A822Y8C9_NELNU|nr:TPA_asm: hypothetical protein HUJ06_009155 [Nelumbo nucifera]